MEQASVVWCPRCRGRYADAGVQAPEARGRCLRCGTTLEARPADAPAAVPLTTVRGSDRLHQAFGLLLGLGVPWLALRRSLRLAVMSVSDWWDLRSVSAMMRENGVLNAAENIDGANHQFLLYALVLLLMDGVGAWWSIRSSWSTVMGTPRRELAASRVALTLCAWVAARSWLWPALVGTSVSGDALSDVLVVLVAITGSVHLSRRRRSAASSMPLPTGS